MISCFIPKVLPSITLDFVKQTFERDVGPILNIIRAERANNNDNTGSYMAYVYFKPSPRVSLFMNDIQHNGSVKLIFNRNKYWLCLPNTSNITVMSKEAKNEQQERGLMELEELNANGQLDLSQLAHLGDHIDVTTYAINFIKIMNALNAPVDMASDYESDYESDDSCESGERIVLNCINYQTFIAPPGMNAPMRPPPGIKQ